MARETDLHVLSSLAFAGVLDELGPAFEEAHDVRLEIDLQPTALLLRRIRGGERANVALLTDAGLTTLLAEGLLQRGTRQELAWSSVGLAVPAGAPRPSIRTEAELVSTMMAAPSVGLSGAGASGAYFDCLLRRLGLFDAIHAKAVVIASGYTGTLLREGRVALAVQQVSELMMVDGIDILGPLPAGLGAETLFSGALFPDAPLLDAPLLGDPFLSDPFLGTGSRGASTAGAAFLRAIAQAGALLRSRGLAPVRPVL